MQLSSKVRVESPAEVAGQVIVAGGLTKRYGDVTAVRDVSLRIPPGEIYGLLGLTVRENLEIVYRLRRLARPAAVPEVIERLALGPYTDRRAGTLSLGNAQ